MHLTSSPIDWYAARAAGIVAYSLLTGVVLLGLTTAGKKRLARWPRLVLVDVHRFGGLLAGTFVGIHVLAIAIDARLPFPATFNEPLRGRIYRIAGTSRVIGSMTGEGVGPQHVLVRTDLLLRPGGLAGATFQMEYLPSGVRCTGRPTSVRVLGASRPAAYSVRAVCVADGERRTVTVSWRDASGLFGGPSGLHRKEPVLGFAGSSEVTRGRVESRA